MLDWVSKWIVTKKYKWTKGIGANANKLGEAEQTLFVQLLLCDLSYSQVRMLLCSGNKNTFHMKDIRCVSGEGQKILSQFSDLLHGKKVRKGQRGLLLLWFSQMSKCHLLQ